MLYFMAWYREHKLDNTYVYDGIKEALDAIQKSRDGSTQNHLKMAVLSNKPVGPSRAIVEALGLGPVLLPGLWRQQLPHQKARSRRRAGASGRGRRICRKRRSSSATPTLTCSPPATPESSPSELPMDWRRTPWQDAPPDVLIDNPHELARCWDQESSAGWSLRQNNEVGRGQILGFQLHLCIMNRALEAPDLFSLFSFVPQSTS